jgi:hypothetical protein
MPLNDMLSRTNGNRFARRFRNDRPNSQQTPAPAPAASPAPAPAPAATLPLPPGVAQGPQNAAFNAFYNTPLYQVPLQEGLESVNANWAARGMLESGAAQKSISDYGAGHAAGGLRDYFSLLGNQQAIGFNAASGQAGASQNYANSIQGANTNYANSLTGLNSAFANNATGLTQGYAGGVSNALGQVGQAQAQGAINAGNINANAIMAQANNSNAMLGGIGNALGSFAGYAAYRPYGS